MPLATAHTIVAPTGPRSASRPSSPARSDHVAPNQQGETRRHAARRARLSGHDDEVTGRHPQLRVRRHRPRPAVRIVRVQVERDREDSGQERAISRSRGQPRDPLHFGMAPDRAARFIHRPDNRDLGPEASIMSWFSGPTHSLPKNATQADFHHSGRSATIFSILGKCSRHTRADRGTRSVPATLGELRWRGWNAKFSTSWQTGRVPASSRSRAARTRLRFARAPRARFTAHGCPHQPSAPRRGFRCG